MSLRVVTPPAVEPVSLLEVKTHLRIDDYAAVTPGAELPHPDDALVSQWIAAARSKCETFCRRAFVTTGYQLALDAFPCEIRLPVGRLIEVTSITYVDGSGTEQTLDSADYQVDAITEPARIRPAVGKAWPGTRGGHLNAVKVNFTAGFGGREAQPAWVKSAVLLVVGDLYRFRGELVVGTILARLPEGAEHLMWTHRIWPE